MHRTLLHAGVALSLLFGASAVHAADVTTAQAATLETQVRDWLSGLMGAGTKLSDHPIAITAAGDHFDVVATLAAMGVPASGKALVLRGAARPLDGGRWSVDDVKADQPMTFTIDTPVPPHADGPAKPGAPKPAMTTTPVHYTVAVDGQDGHILWDPSFATPSNWSSAAKSVTVHAEGGPFPHDSTFGPLTSMATLRPAGPDRLDVRTEGMIMNYAIDLGALAPSKSAVAMKRLQVDMSMTGVSRAKAVAVLQTLISARSQPGATPAKLSPEATRAVLDALQDIASAFSLQETVEGIDIDVQNTHARLDGMTIGFGAKSDNGLLQADLDLSMTGLSLPGLNLGGLEALIPQKVALRPVVSGLSVAELLAMARDSSEGRTPGQGDAMALLSHNGVAAGLESLTVAIGGAVVTGHGTVSMTGPQQVTGAAQIVAENFDALMQTVNGIPAAAQAAPVLIMAKGIGRTVGNTIVWDITYRDGKMLVNNVDLAAMAGGGQRQGPNRAPPRRTP